ncbi:MAG: SDR family NAD(P)-dependent oxidoreductase [Chloroflexi bacterium]|nr:SDR family NAD(P)-dependent oxidoreductase [Chloroflexota bacterium]
MVTGGAAGIGKAVATSLAEAGASVTIADIRHDLASEAAGELRDSGLSADAIAVDVSNAGQVQQMMASVVEAHGGVDILVNNAGIGQSSTLLKTSEQEWDALMGVNLKGTFLCWRAAEAK